MDLSSVVGKPAGTFSFQAASYLQLEAKLNTTTMGGIVFDGYGTDSFKFAAVKASTTR